MCKIFFQRREKQGFEKKSYFYFMPISIEGQCKFVSALIMSTAENAFFNQTKNGF